MVFPPSEKESGVVFRIPMTSVFLRVERIYCDISNGRGCVSFKDSVVAIPWDDNVIRLLVVFAGRVFAVVGMWVMREVRARICLR